MLFSPETEKKCCSSHSGNIHPNWTQQITYGQSVDQISVGSGSWYDPLAPQMNTSGANSAMWVRFRKSSSFSRVNLLTFTLDS